jgi:tetratricopeptide (TPR) repeat protein
MMKKIVLFFSLIFFSTLSISAQELDEALRYIKVGNTYREVDEFTLSESYLKKAVGIITTKFPNQKYWEAAAYENLGLLYRDNNDSEEAQKYFLRAIDIYQKNGYAASIKAIQKLMTSTTNKEEFYAGIDVGATGIKLSVMGVKLNPTSKKLEIKLAKKFKNANVNLVVKNINAYKEGAKAIAAFINDSLSTYEISSDKVIIALSSGLVSRIGQDTVLLKEEIRIALSNPNQKIDVVDYVKEAELTIRGAIPQSKWYETSVIDIGSGNTKGGYYIKPAAAGQAPYMMGIEFPGTKTYSSSIEKKYDPKDLAEYITAIETETKDLALSIRREFDERRPEMKRRKKVYLLGGASYVSNMLMTPDSAKEQVITMNKFAVSSLKKKAATDIVGVRNPDLSKIYDTSKRALAEQKIGEINTNIFPRDEDLISATFLVNAFVQELTRNIAVKEIVFVNGTDTAWISGLIRQNIEAQYGK